MKKHFCPGAFASKRNRVSFRLFCTIRRFDYPIDHSKRDVGDIFTGEEPLELVFVETEPRFGIGNQSSNIEVPQSAGA